MPAGRDRPNVALVVIDVQNDVVANAVLVADAHTTDDCTIGHVSLPAEQIIAHTNLYWHWQRSAHNSGGTVATADVEFGG
jgi:nicotinamidase-related amidase